MDEPFDGVGQVSQESPLANGNEGASSRLDRMMVLILDDDSEVLGLLSALVERLGHTAIATQTAEAFFAEARARHVDFMIVDLQMPSRDGLEVLRQISPACTARIIITSGSGTRVMAAVQQSAESYGLDVAGCLGKPFRIKELGSLLVLQQKLPHSPVLSTQSVVRGEQPAVTDVRLALQRDEIVAYLQPKVCAASGAPRGFEALARWQHPQLGLLPPSMFLPMVSQAGLDLAMTLRMLDQACGFLAALRDPALHVSVNLSTSLCAEPQLPEYLRLLLGRHKLPAEQVYLEVTETGTEELGQVEVDLLTHLRLQGFLLSIDDFGAGQSSLRRLLNVPFEELKIDRGFVAQVRRSKATREVIQSVVRMAKTLRMKVTAEGIEDRATLDILCKLGCDMVQGYHVLRPVPQDAALAWLARHTHQARQPAATR